MLSTGSKRWAAATIALLALAAPAFADASLMEPSSLTEEAPAKFRVQFTTTKGEFIVEVNRSWAPNGADRFYNLVKHGYFDDAHFFRVVPNFVVQFGIHADPKVAAMWRNATFKDDPVNQSNETGTLVFATRGANTRTTQLFINLRTNANLDRQGFSPFARVVEGMDVVKKLYAGYGDAPPRGTGPNQGRVQQEGKPYLDKNFPKLDSIQSAKLMSAGAEG